MKRIHAGTLLPLRGLILPLALALLLGACADLNDDPGEDGTVRVTLDRMFTNQLGSQALTDVGTATAALSSPAASDATTPVKSLVIGAIIVRTRDTPYSPDMAITPAIEEDIEEDLTNSVNFFTIVNLPTSEPTVEFLIPPPSADKWQVAVVALDSKIDVLQDVADSNVGYYGFENRFRNTANAEGQTISITMKRACLVDPAPKGCAQYDENGDIQVTAAVEITGIEVLDASGVDVSSNRGVGGLTFPIVVRANGSSTPGDCNTSGGCTAATAQTYVNSNVTLLSTDTRARVFTTHQKAAGQPDTCTGLDPSSGDGDASNGDAVSDYERECDGPQRYTTFYNQ